MGRLFEDYTVGLVMRHPFGRTITDADNMWFTNLTLNTNPIHFDAHYASQTEFGRMLVNSCLTLSLVTGLSVFDLDHVVANLGWDEVRLPAPVFPGDTIYAESEVVDARPSQSRPGVGIVTVRTRGFNQVGTTVISFKRTIMVRRAVT
jgi:itaconyl-CoA hydratase